MRNNISHFILSIACKNADVNTSSLRSILLDVRMRNGGRCKNARHVYSSY